MALPVILGATVLEIKDLTEAPAIETGFTTELLLPYLAGTVAAFVSGVIACQWMIRLVQRASLDQLPPPKNCANGWRIRTLN